jgi:signal peptidase I
MTDAESRPAPWWQIVTIGRNPRVTALRLAVTVALVVFAWNFVFVPLRVTGPSMLPNYANGQRRFLNRLAYRFAEPQRGDVVAIKTSGLHNLYLKRIIALPGESVRIVQGVVEIDGVPLEEDYVPKRQPWNWPTDRPEWQLGPGEYLFIGDNRTMLMRDHEFGVQKRERIAGKVWQ